MRFLKIATSVLFLIHLNSLSPLGIIIYLIYQTFKLWLSVKMGFPPPINMSLCPHTTFVLSCSFWCGVFSFSFNS